MNSDIIEGNWKQLKGKLKEQWGKLTDDDLDVIEGKREVLAGKIQERYGHDIEAIFGIQPQALTADEAGYLIGFRTADEIRNRVAKARQETHLRLRAKGIRRLRPQGRLSRTLRAIVRSLKRTA